MNYNQGYEAKNALGAIGLGSVSGGSLANAIAPQKEGLRAIERLAEVCKRLHDAGIRAERAADAINGQIPCDNAKTPETPAVTIASLCDSLNGLAYHLENQIERISIGIGC